MNRFTPPHRNDPRTLLLVALPLLLLLAGWHAAIDAPMHAQPLPPRVAIQVVSYPPWRVEHGIMWSRPWFTLFDDGTVIRAASPFDHSGHLDFAATDYYGLEIGHLPPARTLSLIQELDARSGFFDILPDWQICRAPTDVDRHYVFLRHAQQQETVRIYASYSVAERCRDTEPGRAALVDWMRTLHSLAIDDARPYVPDSVDVIVQRRRFEPNPPLTGTPPPWTAFPGSDLMDLRSVIGGPHFTWPVDGAPARTALAAFATTTPEASMRWMADPRSGLTVLLGVRPYFPGISKAGERYMRSDAVTRGVPYRTPRPRISPTAIPASVRAHTATAVARERGHEAWLPILVRRVAQAGPGADARELGATSQP